MLEYIKLTKKSDSVKFLRSLRGNIDWEVSHTKLAINIFYATVPTAALFSKAIAQVVDYFLEEENAQAREEIVDIFLAKEKDGSARIMEYVREALRLNPIVSRLLPVTCRQC